MAGADPSQGPVLQGLRRALQNDKRTDWPPLLQRDWHHCGEATEEVPLRVLSFNVLAESSRGSSCGRLLKLKGMDRNGEVCYFEHCFWMLLVEGIDNHCSKKGARTHTQTPWILNLFQVLGLGSMAGFLAEVSSPKKNGQHLRLTR